MLSTEGPRAGCSAVLPDGYMGILWRDDDPFILVKTVGADALELGNEMKAE
jgi:hypothetical protein